MSDNVAFELWPATDGKRPASQAEWEKHNAYLRDARRQGAAERGQRRAERQAAAAVELRQSKEAALKASALASYVKAGGDPGAFDTAWPAMLAEYRSRLIAQELSEGRPAPAVRINF